MSSPDWCRWHPAKWLSGVLHLNNEQRGVYIQVINVLLDRGECSADPAYLGRLCNCNRQKAARIVAELVTLEKLHQSGGKLHQNRAESERKLAANLSQSGEELAAKRWKNKRVSRAAPHMPIDKNIEESTPPIYPPQQFELEGPANGSGKAHEPPAKPADKPRRKKPATPLPDDWRPDVDYARHQGMADREINFQANKFADYCRANDKRYVDHDAAWRNWVRTYVERRAN